MVVYMSLWNVVVAAAVLLFHSQGALGIPIEEAMEFNDYLQSTVDGEPDEAFDEVFDDDKQNVWEHSGKFEGDIVLSERQRKAILNDVTTPGLARNGLNDVAKRWPKATLVYMMRDDHFSSDQMGAIREGMDDLERNSCLKFKEKTDDDDDYVEIQGRRRGCFSQVGYQGRGKQLLNLTPHPNGAGCMRHGTIVHELLHSLGFFHMQSHTKRDDYVKIAWDNIIDGRENNFKKYNSFETTDFGVPYDYDSVLHYSAYAFSKNGQKTIVPLSDSFVTIGQRHGLSDKDIAKLNRMYECTGSTYDEKSNDFSVGQYKGEIQYDDEDIPDRYEDAPEHYEEVPDEKPAGRGGPGQGYDITVHHDAPAEQQYRLGNKPKAVPAKNTPANDEKRPTDEEFLFSWDRYKDFFPKSFYNFQSWWE